jgi:serine/threonine protein kinase
VDEQNAKISSFGAARVYFSEDSLLQDRRELHLPQMDQVRYLAPEVLRGGPPSRQSDVFSFAIILWQLATCQVPYGNVPLEDLISVLRKDRQRPPLDQLEPGIAQLVEHCWHSDPSKRPAFEEICDRLNSLHLANVECKNKFIFNFFP